MKCGNIRRSMVLLYPELALIYNDYLSITSKQRAGTDFATS